jgi:hypothetical protein
MKVYLQAIIGHVPDQMVHAIATFLEFCYLVRCERLDDDDINKLNELLAKFHTEREIFHDEETGQMDSVFLASTPLFTTLIASANMARQTVCAHR